MIGFALRVGALLAIGVAVTYWLYVLALRKRWVFAGIGALLVAWGAWVYAPANAGRGWAWRDGWNEGSAAANKAVSAFFPSRGDYDAPAVPPGRCYWAFHTSAILYMLSLVVAVFGVELVNRGLVAWRGCLPFQWCPRPSFRRRELNVVWGLGAEEHLVAGGLAETAGKKSVVFALEAGGGGWFDLKEAGNALRALTREGWTWVLGRAERPGPLGRAGRHFFLGPDGYRNAARAEALMRALRARRRRRAVSVYVRTWTDADDDAVHAWVDKWNRELAGTDVQVEAVREEAVVSRKFLLDHPMLDAPGVEAVPEATAVKGAFRVLVAGFGAQGRRLMAEMVGDAQFLDPDGRPVPLEVDVVDPDGASWGWFRVECAEACRRYHIQFHPLDVRKAAFWSWLEREPVYNRVVLATQNDDVNLEAAGRVANAYKTRFREVRGPTRKVVFARVRDHALSVALRKAWQPAETAPYELFGDTAETYAPETLLNGRWDDGAICVNGIWAANGTLPDGATECAKWNREKWMDASMFNKESSRASFFHQRNLLRLVGFKVFDGAPSNTKDRVSFDEVKKRFEEKGRMERLSEMEHMRWVAFHLVRGWRRWTPTREELEALAKGRTCAIKPNSRKDAAPLHADLADYRELAAVDKLFNEVNDAHGWREKVDSAKKDNDLVYGLRAMFEAGFTVTEGLPVKSSTVEEKMVEKDSVDKGRRTK